MPTSSYAFIERLYGGFYALIPIVLSDLRRAALMGRMQRKPRNGLFTAYTEEALKNLPYAWRHLSIEKLNDGFSRIRKRIDYSTASMQ